MRRPRIALLAALVAACQGTNATAPASCTWAPRDTLVATDTFYIDIGTCLGEVDPDTLEAP